MFTSQTTRFSTGSTQIVQKPKIAFLPCTQGNTQSFDIFITIGDRHSDGGSATSLTTGAPRRAALTTSFRRDLMFLGSAIAVERSLCGYRDTVIFSQCYVRLRL